MRDVTIIGAGPAGCIAGVALARLKWDVTLIEQHRFPRDKVCGETLSALGVAVLERVGIWDEVRAIGGARIGFTALHATDGREVVIPLPKAMWGVSRRGMDMVLLEAAREVGVRVLQPARCEAMNGELVIRDLLDNRVEKRRASWVILADGKGALLPRRAKATADFGVKAHFELVDAPRDTVALFGLRGHYVGLAPIEGGVFNVAMSVPGARLAEFSGIDELWAQLLTENAKLREQFLRAKRVSPWLASQLPRFGVARQWPLRVIPIGNAAAALEPIGGEGMGLAMASGEMAGVAVDEAESGGSLGPIEKLRVEFGRLWRMRRFACRGVAVVLSRPGVSGAVLDWVGGSEVVLRGVLGLIGKR